MPKISNAPGTPYHLKPLGVIREDAKKIYENPYRYTPQEAMEGKGDYVGGKHYNRLPDKFQPAEISHAWGLDFLLWNTVKYLSRAGHKEDSDMTTAAKEIDDLKKGIDYMRMRINVLEGRTPLDFGVDECVHTQLHEADKEKVNWLDEPMDSFMERWNADEVKKATDKYMDTTAHVETKERYWKRREAEEKLIEVEASKEYYRDLYKRKGWTLGEFDEDGIPL